MGGPEKPKRTIKAPIKKTRQDLIIEKYGKRAAYLIKNRLSERTLIQLGILKKGYTKQPTSKKIEKQKTSIIDPRNRIRSKYIELSTGLSKSVKEKRFDEFKKHYIEAINSILRLPFSEEVKTKYGINKQQLISDFQRILSISHIESHLSNTKCSGVARGYCQLVDHYFYSKRKKKYLRSCHSMNNCMNTMKEKNLQGHKYKKISNRFSPRIEINKLFPPSHHFTENDIYDPTKNIIIGILYYRSIHTRYIGLRSPFKEMTPDNQHKFNILAYSRGPGWVRTTMHILKKKGYTITSYQDYENAWEKIARHKLAKHTYSSADIKKIELWKKRRDQEKKAGKLRSAEYYNKSIARLEKIINRYKQYKVEIQNAKTYGIAYSLPITITDLKRNNLRLMQYKRLNFTGKHIWEGLRYVRVISALKQEFKNQTISRIAVKQIPANKPKPGLAPTPASQPTIASTKPIIATTQQTPTTTATTQSSKPAPRNINKTQKDPPSKREIIVNMSLRSIVTNKIITRESFNKPQTGPEIKIAFLEKIMEAATNFTITAAETKRVFEILANKTYPGISNFRARKKIYETRFREKLSEGKVPKIQPYWITKLNKYRNTILARFRGSF